MSKTRLKILVIDDNPADAELLRRALKKIEEFEIDFIHCIDSCSGEKALSDGRVDCLFLDYRLGDRDGLDVMRSIQSAGYYVATIVLTGAGNEAIAVEAMKGGAQDYMVKDDIVKAVVTPLALRRSISNAVEQVNMKRLLLEQQTELEAFVSVASHDLKTPLCSIKDSLELIRDFYFDKPIDENGKKFLFASIRMTGRMTQLVESLLEYSRVGRASRELVPVDLKECIESVVESLHTSIEQSNAEIVIGRMPGRVAGAAEALFQLLQNLIANALKFRSDEPPLVRITSMREGARWRISVRDNGIGVDSRHHGEIFAPFKRLHSREQFDGSGVGLATCKRIVDQHHGRIWLESKPGEGSTFHFTLDDAAQVAQLPREESHANAVVP